MTASYNKLGIQFLYPENWKLVDDAEAIPHVISLESPDKSSTWSAHIYDLASAPEDIFRESIDALQDTYSDIEITPIAEEDLRFLKQIDTVHDGSIKAVEAMFYCLDFLIQAKLYLLSTDSNWFLVLCQAEDRDFDQQELVFTAITTSLFTSST